MIKEDRKLDLSERLLRYSAAASLAASGAIAVAAPQARADGTSRILNCVMDANQEFCDIDFDNDGHAEFQLALSTTAFASSLSMQLISSSGDEGVSFVYSGSPWYGFAAVLPYGSSVSAGRGDWINSPSPLLYTAPFRWGNWAAPKGHATDPTQGAYLGVKFDLDYGNIHYGWIELYIPSNGDVTVKRIGCGARKRSSGDGGAARGGRGGLRGPRGRLRLAAAQSCARVRCMKRDTKT
jgi:hypothetical protein